MPIPRDGVPVRHAVGKDPNQGSRGVGARRARPPRPPRPPRLNATRASGIAAMETPDGQ